MDKALLAALSNGPVQPPKMVDLDSVGAQGDVGAPPIDAAVIAQAAGTAPTPPVQRIQIDPMLAKEFEIIQLRLKLVDAEEQIAVQQVQQARARRQELLRAQQALLARAKSQLVVRPDVKAE